MRRFGRTGGLGRQPRRTGTANKTTAAGLRPSFRFARNITFLPHKRAAWAVIHEQLKLLEEAGRELPALFIVSKVALAKGPLSVEVERAPGTKCERCWMYTDDVGKDRRHPTICAKCASALG